MLKERRIQVGLSQEEMAKKIGVTRLTYWRWEKKNFIPKLRDRTKVERILRKEE